MNKKQLILSEAKKLFGSYGYLGFTLKQLASACDMTSPALYYFYSSKAELFKDCFLSEIEIRHEVVMRCVENAVSFPEFAQCFSNDLIEVCELSSFRTGQSLRDVVHLPAEMQAELQSAWNDKIVAPVETFLRTVLSTPPPNVSYRLLASFFIHMATFSAAHTHQFARGELSALFAAMANGLLQIQGQSLTQPTVQG